MQDLNVTLVLTRASIQADWAPETMYGGVEDLPFHYASPSHISFSPVINGLVDYDRPFKHGIRFCHTWYKACPSKKVTDRQTGYAF